MQFVYPLKSGKESKELKYSIRSVAKFYPDAEIVIIGQKPKWIRKCKELKLIEKQFSKPHENVWNKIKLFASVNRQKDFIWMNDDMILTKEFDWIGSQLSYGNLDERKQNMGEPNFYTTRIDRTIALLKGLNYEPMCYDIHQPMHMNSEFILWMDNHFKVKELGYLFKTIYGVLTFNQYNQLTFPHSKINSKEDYQESMIYLSTSGKFKDYDLLESLYPDKCKFEIADN